MQSKKMFDRNTCGRYIFPLHWLSVCDRRIITASADPVEIIVVDRWIELPAIFFFISGGHNARTIDNAHWKFSNETKHLMNVHN